MPPGLSKIYNLRYTQSTYMITALVDGIYAFTREMTYILTVNHLKAPTVQIQASSTLLSTLRFKI